MNFNKIKWTAGLLLVFFLILATNLIDRNNFERVRDSMVTIYEDRLVVKNLIFKMTMLLQEKKLAVATEDLQFFEQRNTVINSDLSELLQLFRDTKLTSEEERTLLSFEEKFAELQQLENNYQAQSEAVSEDQDNAVTTQLEILQHQLETLSEIQLDEGKRQMFIGNRAINSSELLLQMEIYILVAIALILQIAILYTPKSRS